MNFYERSCENGISAGCFNIANMYEVADGVDKDIFKTVEYLTKVVIWDILKLVIIYIDLKMKMV